MSTETFKRAGHAPLPTSPRYAEGGVHLQRAEPLSLRREAGEAFIRGAPIRSPSSAQRGRVGVGAIFFAFP